MLSKESAREVLDGVFEDTALMVGGLITVHPASENLVWGLARGLDSIRAKAIQQIDAVASGEDVDTVTLNLEPRPHPAIEEFLSRVRRDR